MKHLPHVAFDHRFTITTRYDKAKDITTTVLSPGKPSVTDTGDNKLYIIASFAYKGVQPTRPRSVFLGFSSLQGLEDLERLTITLILEGDTHLDLQGKIVNTEGSGSRLSLIGTYLPSDEFIKMAQSPRVEVRLQNLRSTFSEEQLEGLRDLASRIKA